MLDERKDRGADSSSGTLMKICRGGHDTVQDEKQCEGHSSAHISETKSGDLAMCSRRFNFRLSTLPVPGASLAQRVGKFE